MKLNICKVILLLILFCNVGSISAEVRWHCENDSQKITAILETLSSDDPIGKRVGDAALALVGIPAAESADNDTLGTIIVRIDSLSRREFINMAMALAIASRKNNPSMRDFEKALQDVSRKKGEDQGFPSQFFYASDWIVDNVYRGTVKEMTEYLEGGNYKTKTLDYVSHHKELFPALKDSVNLDKIKNIEMGLRSHRIPHLKKQTVNNKNAKDMMEDGDIIIMLPPENDYDIYDMGFVIKKNGEPYLIHISKDSETVELDPFPLARRFKVDGQFFYGFRWLRPIE